MEAININQLSINYNSASALRTFLDENDLAMRKKFGQNFLINPSVRNALVSGLDAPAGESVWEIGPGLGAMTVLLLEKDLSVRAFELDPGFSRILRILFADNSNFTLVEGDVLKTWPAAPVAPFLLGNLPYNIAAVLLAGLIEKQCFFKRMIVTVQREVALRMMASPGSDAYSSFSVLCASAYRVKPLMIIKGACFYPRPNVDSQALMLELNNDAVSRIRPVCFYPLLRALFASRRKTIKNNLAAFPDIKASLVNAVLEASRIDGNKRAENLAIEEFEALAQALENMGLS